MICCENLWTVLLLFIFPFPYNITRTSIGPWNKHASCCYFCFVLFFDKLHVIFDTAKLLYNAPKRDRKLGACSFIFTKKKRIRSASYVVIPVFVVLVAICYSVNEVHWHFFDISITLLSSNCITILSSKKNKF